MYVVYMCVASLSALNIVAVVQRDSLHDKNIIVCKNSTPVLVVETTTSSSNINSRSRVCSRTEYYYNSSRNEHKSIVVV